MTDIEALRLSRQQDAARESFGTEPDANDIGNRPTRPRDVFTALALGAVAIGLGIAAVVGVWH